VIVLQASKTTLVIVLEFSLPLQKVPDKKFSLVLNAISNETASLKNIFFRFTIFYTFIPQFLSIYHKQNCPE
jgi:hypothetical protein